MPAVIFLALPLFFSCVNLFSIFRVLAVLHQVYWVHFAGVKDVRRLLLTADPDADTASVLTTSTYSSVRSDDAPSLFDSASSVRTASDTSSARGSIISNMSARTAKLLGRRTSGAGSSRHSTSSNGGQPQQQPHNQSTDTLPDDDSASVMTTNSTNSAKQRGTFVCGFCREEGITKTCTRKNDLKRHIEDFHSINALWFCNHDGCSMVFDWPTVYKTHLKKAHGGSRSIVADDVRVTLCPQTVFACGFDRCIQVFESSSDAEAPSTFKEYVAHVIKHLDDVGSSSSSSSSSTPGLQWSYSTRLRNLMRQSAVLNTWLDSYSEADREALEWQPQTTGVLRKLLETRHILPRDVHLLVQYAFALGSNLPPAAVPDIHDVFRIPVSQECQMQVPGHIPARPPHPMMHQPSRLAQQQQPQIRIPQQHHQQHHHMAQPPPPPPQQPSEADQFSFKISRPSAPPHLAHYYAAQRRTFHAKPPVRSGRSARPPTMSQQQQQQQHQGYHHQQPQQQHGMFDPSAAGMWQQQHQQPYAQMTPDRGIVAADLRSLRSMASTSTNGSQASHGSGGTADVVDADMDVDMGDAHMMDLSGYTMPPAAHTMSSTAVPTTGYMDCGLQSPAPSSSDGVKLENQQFTYDVNGY